jgi:hypothetical protein
LPPLSPFFYPPTLPSTPTALGVLETFGRKRHSYFYEMIPYLFSIFNKVIFNEVIDAIIFDILIVLSNGY